MTASFPSMIEDFSFQGTWNTDLYRGGRTGGVLTFTPLYGLNVEMHGYFSSIEHLNDLFFDSLIISQLTGVISNLMNVSMTNCRSSGSSTFAGPSTYTRVNFSSSEPGYFSDALTDPNLKTYKQVAFSFTLLSDWLGLRLIKEEKKGSRTAGLQSVNISYEHSHQAFSEFECDDHVVRHQNILMGYNSSIDERTISFRPSLIFTFNEGKDTSFIHKLAIHYRTLLTMLTGSNVYLTYIVLMQEPKGTDYDFNKADAYSVIGQDVKSITNGKTHHHMPFSLLNLKNYIHHIFARSRVTFSDLAQVIDLWLMAGLTSKSYLSFKTLALVQALEGFHRIRFDSHYLQPDEYKPICKELHQHYKSKLPEELKKVFNSALGHMNQYSLKDRVLELLESIPEDVRNLIASDCDKFARDVRDFRHGVSHALRREPYSDEKLEQMADLYYRLHVFIMVLLWIDLEVDQGEIHAALARGYPDLLRRA